MSDIPDWAFHEADNRSLFEVGGNYRRLAARLIAKHEEPPVDPLLVEARELTARHYGRTGSPIAAQQCREGTCDDWIIVQNTLEALKRGIEIGKSQVQP